MKNQNYNKKYLIHNISPKYCEICGKRLGKTGFIQYREGGLCLECFENGNDRNSLLVEIGSREYL